MLYSLVVCTFYYIVWLFSYIVVSRFLDMDQVISMLVQIPKQETVKTSESEIAAVICLKHCLELVIPLKKAIDNTENPLLSAFHKVIAYLLSKIQAFLHIGFMLL